MINSGTPPVKRRIQQVAFNARCVDLVAETLDGVAANAPFRLPNAAVYQVTVPGTDGRPATMLTLWPSIRRVDAIGAAATVVFTDVLTVDLVEGVEVQFRRGNRDLLIVARGGKVIVRA
ncbi:MAG: hypothetical protein ACRDJH_23430 [Thermomicrobiales bacterium]